MLLWGVACVVCISPQLVSSASRPLSLLRKPQQPGLGLDGQRYLSRRGRMDGPWPASCCAPWPVSLDEAHRGPWELWPSSCLYISGRGPSMLGARLFPFPSQAWRLGSKKRRRDLLLLGKMKSAAASPSCCPTRAENPGEPNQGFCKCQRALSYSKYSPVKISEMI